MKTHFRIKADALYNFEIKQSEYFKITLIIHSIYCILKVILLLQTEKKGGLIHANY